MSDAVTVRFFASLREAVGRDALCVSVNHSEQLLTALSAHISSTALDALSAPNVRIAVNQCLLEEPCALRGGDEVAFLPPVTGG